MTQAPWIVGVIVALVGAGGLGALLQSRSQSRKTNAEAVKTNVEAEVTLGGGWQQLYQAAREDAAQAKADGAAARAESAQARKELNEMRERLVIVERHDEECTQRLAALEAHAAPEALERKVVTLLDDAIQRREERGHGRAGRANG